MGWLRSGQKETLFKGEINITADPKQSFLRKEKLKPFSIVQSSSGQTKSFLWTYQGHRRNLSEVSLEDIERFGAKPLSKPLSSTTTTQKLKSPAQLSSSWSLFKQAC